MQFPAKRKFATWLACRQAEVVGIPSDACDCPLARFLVSEGFEVVAVRDSHIVHGQFGHLSMPKWAQAFVASIDAAGNPTGTLGETALNVLHYRSTL